MAKMNPKKPSFPQFLGDHKYEDDGDVLGFFLCWQVDVMNYIPVCSDNSELDGKVV